MLEKHEIMVHLRDMVLCDDNADIKSMALDLLLHVDRNMSEVNKPYFDTNKVDKVKFIKFIREYLHGSDACNNPRLELKTSDFSDKQYVHISLLNTKLLSEAIMEYLIDKHNK